MDKIFIQRRLEALSDTVFGVAMTLLVYNLPSPETFRSAPSWGDVLRQIGPHLLPLFLSFVISGLFWLSHHRRLAAAPEGGRWWVYLNLAFLFSIMLLPATTNLFGTFEVAGDVVAIYGSHLAAIAIFNLALWVMAITRLGRGGDRRDWRNLAAPAYSAIVLSCVACLALLHYNTAERLWYLALLSPLVDARALRRDRAGS